jgi:hypothetical protein
LLRDRSVRATLIDTTFRKMNRFILRSDLGFRELFACSVICYLFALEGFRQSLAGFHVLTPFTIALGVFPMALYLYGCARTHYITPTAMTDEGERSVVRVIAILYDQPGKIHYRFKDYGMLTLTTSRILFENHRGSQTIYLAQVAAVRVSSHLARYLSVQLSTVTIHFGVYHPRLLQAEIRRLVRDKYKGG